MRHNQQGKGWWVTTYWQEPRPSYKCEMCVSQWSVRIWEKRERQASGQGLTSPAVGLDGKLSWLCWIQVYGERIDFGITGGLRFCTMIWYQMIKVDYCLFGFVLCITYFNVSIRTYPLVVVDGRQRPYDNTFTAWTVWLRNYYVAYAFVVCNDYYIVCDEFEIFDNDIWSRLIIIMINIIILCFKHITPSLAAMANLLNIWICMLPASWQKSPLYLIGDGRLCMQ